MGENLSDTGPPLDLRACELCWNVGMVTVRLTVNLDVSYEDGEPPFALYRDHEQYLCLSCAKPYEKWKNLK